MYQLPGSRFCLKTDPQHCLAVSNFSSAKCTILKMFTFFEGYTCQTIYYIVFIPNDIFENSRDKPVRTRDVGLDPHQDQYASVLK